MKKKNPFEGINHKLTVVHYKVPVNLDYDEAYDPLIEFKEDMVIKTETIEVERGAMHKLTQHTRAIKKFNNRQAKYARDFNKDYLTLKRIKK